jgi:hypothetical protein
MIRRISGVFLCVVFVAFGLWGSSGWWWLFTGENIDVIVIDGFATIWSSVAGVLMFGGLLFTLLVFSMKWIDKHAPAIAVVTAFILSPIIAGGVLYSLKNKSSGFTECSELRRSSRLHSSKTYAITPQVCQRIVSDTQAREL